MEEIKMTNLEYEARRNEALYDSKCLARQKAEQQKFRQIYDESRRNEIIWSLKQRLS